MNKLKIFILSSIFCFVSHPTYAGVYINLYTGGAPSGPNSTQNHTGINSQGYSDVRMLYNVDLTSVCCGYAVPFFSGSWTSKCNGTTIRVGNNSNNNGAPSGQNKQLTDNVSAYCANNSNFSVQLSTSGWGPTANARIGSLIVQGYKDPPVSTAQSALSINQNTTSPLTALSVSDPQQKALTVVVDSGVSHGTLQWSGTSFTYQPNNCWNGTDSFQYHVDDIAGQSSTIRTITINVAKVNNPPSISNISDVSMKWHEQKTIAISGVAAGLCGGPISVTASSNNQTVTINPAVSYTSPNTNATLTLSVVQPVAKQLGSSTITVTVNDNYNNPVSKTFNADVQWVAPLRK